MSEQDNPYKAAGVDVEKANTFISNISERVKETHSSRVLSSLTGFSGLYALGQYKDPVLVSGTDGVGTKLEIAKKMQQHNTIGIDLVAMCVNDVIVTGATPLFFLDYLATGALDPTTAASVIDGIATGCKQAQCSLIGGETAEMPGMYSNGTYDLAGFCVGVVERDDMIDGHTVKIGDTMLSLSSSGLHSNGFSLVRKLFFEDSNATIDEFVPEVGELGQELLRPTRIYVDVLEAIKKLTTIKSISHITGGGFYDNIHRTLPKGVTIDALAALLNNPPARVEELLWKVQPIFKIIQQLGSFSTEDMLRVFNCGVGMTIVIPTKDIQSVMTLAASMGCAPTILGNVVKDI